MKIKLLDKYFDLTSVTRLTQQLNPNLSLKVLEKHHKSMFDFENYRCFGFFDESQRLIGVSSGWITVRLYSGKQLEIDNIVIDKTLHSKGIGAKFINQIEHWAYHNKCETIELNTYVQNEKSHKFYFNQGFKVLGFHFQKIISKS